MTAAELIERFTTKAELVSAKVSRVGSLREALERAVAICDEKEACQLLASGCEEALSPAAEAACETKQAKIIVAPALDDDTYAELEALSRERDFVVIREGMRGHLGGTDVAFTVCDWGIAETGSLVLGSSSEELRLATMISEIHVAVLPVSKIVADSLDLEDWLTERMMDGPDYTAFITGASRTADIERVLALGVHGPLELHILLLED
jgi:L-lactate dehydrogenase complex protein LldG